MKLSNLLLAGALVGLSGCGDDSKKKVDARVPLHGIVYDGNSAIDPRVGCWVFVDDGGAEVLTTQTAIDGTFTVEVLEGAKVTVTAGRTDLLMATFVGIDPAALSGPVVFYLPVRDPSALPTADTMVVSGTVAGTPATAGGFFFYGNDQSGQSYRMTSSPDPVSFTFFAEKCGTGDTLGYTVAALDMTTAEIFDVAAFTVSKADPQPVAVTFSNNPPVDLVVTMNQPMIDGAPMTTASPTYTYWHSMTGLIDPSFSCKGQPAISGFGRGLTASGSDLVSHVPYVPLGTYRHMLTVNLNRDFNDPTTGNSWAYETFAPGTAAINVHMLDAPDVDRSLTFKPGRVLTWGAIEGAGQYRLVMVANNLSYWVIFTTEPEVSMPRLPASFDPSVLAAGGGWILHAISGVPVWDHIYNPDDPFEPYKGSTAMGSLVQLTP